MIRTRLRRITQQGQHVDMDAEDVDEIMAQVRLRAALEAHIEASEEVPDEVREQARSLFLNRRLNG